MGTSTVTKISPLELFYRDEPDHFNASFETASRVGEKKVEVLRGIS